jgi:hypothetical protein
VTRTGTSDGSAPNIGKIDREPDLAADAWACNVFASEQAESKTHTVAERVLSAYHDLELASAQIPVIAKPAVKLTTQRQPGREVVQDRKAAGVHMAARGCNPQHARAGITREHARKRKRQRAGPPRYFAPRASAIWPEPRDDQWRAERER